MAIAHDHFWLGTGPGTFGSIYPKYKTAQTEEAQLVHNNFLEMWSDSGLLAFVVFAALWLLAIQDAFRLARQRRGDMAAVALCAALTGWVAHSLVDFDLYIPGIALPAFLLLGMLQGLKELPSVRPVVPRGSDRWLLGLVCVAVLGAVLWIEGRVLAASVHYGLAISLANSDSLAAVDEIERAANLSPNNAYYQGVAGNLVFRERKFDKAIAYYEAAIQNDPFRAVYHWELAQAEMKAHGLSERAVRELRQAVALNPTQACDDPKRPCYRKALAEAEESVRQAPTNLLQSNPAGKK